MGTKKYIIGQKIIFSNEEVEILEIMEDGEMLVDSGDIIMEEQINKKIVSEREWFGKDYDLIMQEKGMEQKHSHLM